MKKKLCKLFSKALVIIGIITGLFLVNEVNASENDSHFVKNKFEDVYGVYSDPNNTHIYYGARYTMNGETAYCIEPNVAIDTEVYSSGTDFSISNYTNEQIRYIRLVAFYGYDYPNHQTNKYYMAAQEIMWEYLRGVDIYWTTTASVNGTRINVDAEKNEILSLINKHYTKPSFNNTTITYNIGDNVSLNDSNNILSEYQIVNSNGLNTSISGNSLKFNASDIGNYQIQLARKSYTSKVQLIYYNGNNQKMISSGSLDPVIAKLNLKVVGGKISIEKLDKDNNTNIPQGDATLKGAKYGIFNSKNEQVDTLIIGEKETTKYLPFGDYTIKELEASTGYNLDNTIYSTKLDNDNVEVKVDVYEKVIERQVTFFKVYASDKTGFLVGEPNVTFDIYLKSSGKKITSMTSNEEGLATSKLVYGTYIVKQVTSTKDYYKVDDFEITIDKQEDEPLYKVLGNSEIVAKLKVIKIDSETGEVIKRSGIKFKIKSLDTGEYICQKMSYPNAKTICEYETDENGEFVTPENLKSGKYVLEEMNQVIDKYTWNETSESFEIGENSKLINDDDYGILFEVKFGNNPVKGTIKINKVGEELIKENDSYKYNEIPLENVTFGLYADEDIYSGTGKLIYSKGELIDKLITNELGYAELNNLYLGKYYLKELSSSNNNIVDKTKHKFELKYKDQYTTEVTYEFNLKNYLGKGTLEFTKTDFSTSETLPNTLIEIYDASDDTLIFSGRTDSEGKIIIDDLPLGDFYILEKDAPEGYELNEEKMYFSIIENGEIVKCTMEDHKINEIEVPNTLKNDSKIIECVSIILLIAGIGIGLYAKKKK